MKKRNSNPSGYPAFSAIHGLRADAIRRAAHNKAWFIPLMMAAAMATSACGASRNSSGATAEATKEQFEQYDTMYSQLVENETMADQKAEEAAPESGLTDSAGSAAFLPAGRKLIRTVDMGVETDSFDTLVASIQAKIGQLGGYVEQSNITGNSLNSRGEPLPRYASITARIPQDRLDAFVTSVEHGGNVTNKSESASDITLQYSDLESMKKSLAVEQERIWTFLEKAESIDTVITLEQRLTDIRYQLESMESQLRLYDNQVVYSTVRLTVNEVTDFTPTAPEGPGTRIKNGFSKNLHSMGSFLMNFCVVLVTTSPFWAPFLVIAAGIVLLNSRNRKKLKKTQAPVANPVQPDGSRLQEREEPHAAQMESREAKSEPETKEPPKT